MNEDDTIDCFQVTLTRSPLHGFGIAISGGNDEMDNQSLIISDVIKNGPADGKLFPNDRLVSVNGHPVVRYMEYPALKLLRESTDYVNLIVQRRKHPVILSDNDLSIKCIVNKTRKDEKFGIIIDCRYFIKNINDKHQESLTNIHEGDEVIKINEIPLDRLTLQEAQKLIDKTKGQLILHTKPNKQLQSDYNPHIFQSQELIRPNSGTRYVSFVSETSSIGIRLAGGNKYGLFICEIQANSVAYKAGLFIGDKIFSVNNIDFTNFTREEAVSYLMNMKISPVNMIVSNLPYEYEQLLADVGGDSLYIRAHFACTSSNDEELAISINDIFHVTDTLYNGQVGYWVATKLNSFSPQDKLTGAIPNKSRAEQLVDVAPNLSELIKSKQMSLKRKLRSKFTDKRSVLSVNHFKDDSIFDKVLCWKPMINSKFSTYERVKLKSITIIRPVVLLGPLADIARDRLLNQYPDQFESPEMHIQSPTKSQTNIIKLQSIKNVVQKDRHCLLDITPSAIEQLNYTECYPIVIYFKISDRRMIKQIRHEYGKFYQKSSRRLLETSERLEHYYSYLFTSIIQLNSTINWFEILKSQIELQQEQPIWMSHDRFIDKDLLKSDEYFISTNYSDEGEIYNQSNFDLIKNNYLQRVASDPAMFQKHKTYLTNLSCHNEEDDHLSMQTSTMSLPDRSHSVMEIPTTDKNSYLYQRSLPHPKVDQKHLFRADKYITVNQPKIVSTNSLQINGSSVNRNPSRQPLMTPKLRTIYSNDRLSSSDSNGSLRKNLIDKSTMTMAEKKAAINLYATWNKSTAPRPTILSNNSFNSYNENAHCHNSHEKFCTESLLKQKMCSSKKYNHTSIPLDSSKYLSLQKPRVYTYDDRNLSNQQQQQHILSSSSGSSTLSFKDKNIKEVGETRSYSIQDGCNVIGSARGVIDYYGGKLSCPLTGVSLFIPMGAIPEGIEQEIYFQVCQDSSHIEKFNGQLLSPIVICGPQGIQFDKPVELILPHSAGNDARQLSLMLHGTNQNSKTNFQEGNKSSLMNGIHHVTNANVSILIDHF